jgi:hypothetical protein
MEVFMTITPEQRQAIEIAGGEPVRLEDPLTGQVYIVLKAEVYEEIREILDDDRERAAWAHLNRKARSAWALENPY